MATTKQALRGRIAQMDTAFTVIPDGVLWIDGDKIVAVTAAAHAPPAGFESVAIETTGGTIFPGMIELHNHLSYNPLRLWKVPKLYTDRDQWGSHPDYRKLISGAGMRGARLPDCGPRRRSRPVHRGWRSARRKDSPCRASMLQSVSPGAVPNKAPKKTSRAGVAQVSIMDCQRSAIYRGDYRVMWQFLERLDRGMECEISCFHGGSTREAPAHFHQT